MIGLIVTLLTGIPTFYVCMLATVAYAHRIAARHGSRNILTMKLANNEVHRYITVDEQHCFWCAFWVHAAKGIAGERS